MEVLSRLETKIETLLQKLSVLKEENARLKDESQQSIEDLRSENARLRQDLERERTSKEEVLSRIDGLLTKLQDETS